MNGALTADRLRELLAYNPDTGAFTWLKRTSNRVSVGDEAGYKNRVGYVEVRIDGDLYHSHRLAFLYTNGAWPADEVDHIDGDPSNNRWTNLRQATRSQNTANTKLARNNTSGTKGVSWDRFRGKWVVSVGNKRLGRFADRSTANAVRSLTAISQFGEFSREFVS